MRNDEREQSMFDSIVQACRAAGLEAVVEPDPRGLILKVFDPAGNLVCRTLFGDVDNLEQAAINIALYLKPLLSIEPLPHRADAVERDAEDADNVATSRALTVDDIVHAGEGAPLQEAIGGARGRAARAAQAALSELEFALEELAWLERTDWKHRGQGDDLLLVRSIAKQLESSIAHLGRVPTTTQSLSDELLDKLGELFGHLRRAVDRLSTDWADHGQLPQLCGELGDELAARGAKIT